MEESRIRRLLDVPSLMRLLRDLIDTDDVIEERDPLRLCWGGGAMDADADADAAADDNDNYDDETAVPRTGLIVFLVLPIPPSAFVLSGTILNLLALWRGLLELVPLPLVLPLVGSLDMELNVPSLSS